MASTNPTLDLFYLLVDQFREHGADFIRSRLETEFEPDTLHKLSEFGYAEFNSQQTLRRGQIEHIIEIICNHSGNDKEPTCLFCGEHTHYVHSCSDPRIEETWQQLLEEVNQDDLEDVDLDSVRAMLQREVSDEIITAISIQYGDGHFMEKLSTHKDRIIFAIKEFIEELRIKEPFIDSSTQCSVHLNEQPSIEDTFCHECPICYNEDLKTIQMTTLGCLHQFCRLCLVTHIEKNQFKCPMCRTPVNQIVTRQRDDYDAVCAILTERTEDTYSDGMPDLVSVTTEDHEDIPETLYILPNNNNYINPIYNNQPRLDINWYYHNHLANTSM